MDEIPEKMDSKFRYVLVASNRAEQLMRGARARVDVNARKPTVTAMKEVNSELVEWDFGPAPEPEMDEVAEIDETLEATEETAETAD